MDTQNGQGSQIEWQLDIQEKTYTRLDTSKGHGISTFDIMDNYQYTRIAKGQGLLNSWRQCCYGI